VFRFQGKPQLWEAVLNKILTTLDEEQKFEIRRDIYSKFHHCDEDHQFEFTEVIEEGHRLDTTG